MKNKAFCDALWQWTERKPIGFEEKSALNLKRDKLYSTQSNGKSDVYFDCSERL